MNALKLVFKTFIYVLAGTLISTAVFITIFDRNAELSVILLWQVICVSMVSSIGSLIFLSKKEISKKQMKIRQTIHFIFINIIVLGNAILCKWVDIDRILQMIAMLILVAIVYFCVCRVLFRQAEKEADYINQRLRRIYPEEEKE